MTVPEMGDKMSHNSGETSTWPVANILIDENAVASGLEWGMTVEAPVLQRPKEAIIFGVAWAAYGSVQLLKTSDLRSQGLTIRANVTDSNVAKLHGMMVKLYDMAETNVERRAGYQEAVEDAKSGNRSEQLRNAVKGLASSVLGGTAVAGTTAIVEATMVLAYQPNPLAFGTGWAIGGLIKSAAKAIKTGLNHRRDMKEMVVSDLPEDAEQNWQQLYPLVEQVFDAYTTRRQPGDVYVQSGNYKMKREEIEDNLEKPGGPRPEDYEEILDDLYLGKNGDNIKNRLINPAVIVEEMIINTGGKIWDSTFSDVVSGLADAQRQLAEKKIEIDKLPRITKKTPGLVGQERYLKLKNDIGNLKDAIELSVLQLYKLNLLLNSEAIELSDPVVDPYSVTDKIADSHKTEAALADEDGTGNWPLLENGIPKLDQV